MPNDYNALQRIEWFSIFVTHFRFPVKLSALLELFAMHASFCMNVPNQ